MTLLELEDSLPNGLHDAEVRKIVINYPDRKVTFEVAVWVGNMEDPPERREAYKVGHLEVSGVQYVVIEAPDPKYPYKTGTELTIDGCDASKHLNEELLASLPMDAFVRSFWVNEWNAFIHFAALNAEIVWMNEGAVTYRRYGH